MQYRFTKDGQKVPIKTPRHRCQVIVVDALCTCNHGKDKHQHAIKDFPGETWIGGCVLCACTRYLKMTTRMKHNRGSQQ